MSVCSEEMINMGEQRNLANAVVLTTPERSGYFASELGADVDMRFNPSKEPKLEDFLHNVMLAGGKLAVIDEDYFFRIDDMIQGLENFMNEEADPERLKLIVVCSDRKPGDAVLAHLVMYCGIYDLIFDKQGVSMSLELRRLLKKGNSRQDALHLAEHGRWNATRSCVLAIRDDSPVASNSTRDDKREFKRFEREMFVNVGDVRLLNVKIELEALGSVCL